jgi:D-sedoheptulose 7-phosphate isomerase
MTSGSSDTTPDVTLGKHDGLRGEAPAARTARDTVSRSLMELSRLAAALSGELGAPVERAGRLIVESMRSGGKLLACGNGGSAADAQHFVAELLGRMGPERRSLPAVTLSVDPSAVTAIGNDYGYDNVFARQVEGLGRKGDVLLAISTSGRSPNVLRAIRTARDSGMRVVALSGKGGDPLLEECDVCIHIPAESTQRVQELHMAVLHAICEHVDEQVLSGALTSAPAAGQRE